MAKKKNQQLLGFIAGFGGVALLALLAGVGWVAFGPSPSSTLVPSAVPVSQQVTVVPATSEAQQGTPLASVYQSSPPTSPPTATEPAPSPIQIDASLPRSQPLEYVVREGDTLFDIALAYGLSVETLQTVNNLESETINPGQVLIIPPEPLPTPTPRIDGDALVHTVSSGETLITIAENYSVTVEAIQVANDLDSEVIQPGLELRIPLGDAEPTALAAEEQATPDSNSLAEATTAIEEPWSPSILEGDLARGYPLTVEGERFTLHYQPDTPAARAPNQVAALIESALDHIEGKLDVTLEDHFDVYVAGSLFASDDIALRGRSFSSQRRNFYLYDDTGTPDERRYVIVHELTHLVVWNTVSRPSSVMLHEGLAVYTGVEAMEAAGFIPLPQFCAAYQQTGQLPRLSGSRAYLGHIRDLDLYFAAGCFVQHLIETYGVKDFKQLFSSGNYSRVYGSSLTKLEAEWVKTLDAVGDELDFDPDDLVTGVTDVTGAYERLFADFHGTPSQMAAYRELDQARIAVLQGRFDEAQTHLSEFETHLEGE
jgi:LysM repeat protein